MTPLLFPTLGDLAILAGLAALIGLAALAALWPKPDIGGSSG